MSESRERVFDAAVRVFAETGYSGASMDRIAAVAGMQKSSIYNHFASKEAIKDEIYRTFRAASSRSRLVETVLDGREYASAVDALLAVVVLLESDMANIMKGSMWIFISGEQYHDRKAAELIIDLTEDCLEDTRAFFRELDHRGLLEARVPVDRWADSYAYSYHALFMEYAMRYVQGLPLDGIRARLAEHAKVFGGTYS